MPTSKPTKNMTLTRLLSPANFRASANNSCVTRNNKATIANEMHPMKSAGLAFKSLPIAWPHTPTNVNNTGGITTRLTCFGTERVMFCTLALNERPRKPISRLVAIDMQRPELREAVNARPIKNPSSATSVHTAHTKGHEIFSLKLACLLGIGDGAHRRNFGCSVWPWICCKVNSKARTARRAPATEVCKPRLSALSRNSSPWNCIRAKFASSNGSG
mmetsp:Transcript_36511/g.118049  ORF Transcript_36511/g.118049 Transcript_36511/m.118049 type:complete len:217 (-) Transcript_36511:620-1270(-)